jgi:glycosyltransferase involved in cell wall biosynthesis
MRVLIVHPKMDMYGGAELLIVRMTNYLAKHHIEHALLTTNLNAAIEKDLVGTQVFSYPYTRLHDFRAPLNLFRLLRVLNAGIRKHVNKFDVINVHNYPAELSIFSFQRPVVWMCNEPPEVHVGLDAEPAFTVRRIVIAAILGLEKQIVRKYVTDVVVADPFNAHRFNKLYGMTPHIINYGVDYRYFSEHGEEDINGRDPRRFTVLHVGMLTPQKRQIESLKAIDKLRGRISGIRLVLAGSGDENYLFSLKEFVRSRRMENIVRFEGHVAREQVRKLYHTSDVLLHPVGPQGGWLAPFEAIAAKLPVIVSKDMTASDLIEKNNLGVVTDSYADAVHDIYNNRSKYHEMALERAEWVRDHLSWDNFCQEMLTVFSKAAADG